MKSRYRILNVFFAFALLTALASQSAHGFADYREQLAERHCEHTPYGKASIMHTHAGLGHCCVCDFTFAPYAGFEIRLIAPFIFSSHADIRFPDYAPEASSPDGFPAFLRGPPAISA